MATGGTDPRSSASGNGNGRGVVRPPNMGEVARLAGVSHQTVSRVLNGHVNVSDQTRERVLEAMRELDYRPNHAAKSLVTGRSSTLGVVSFDTTLFGPASTLAGVERAARQARYAVNVASLASLDKAAVLEAIDRLRGQSVAGIVVIAPTVATFEALASVPLTTPVVAVEGIADLALSVVAVDQFLGARLVTEHLLDLGHRTVWHLRGPHGWSEADGRERGWRDALKGAGAVEPEPLLVGDWSPASGYEAGLVLAARKEVTAIFAANDQMAVGVLRALHERGRRVPHDVSVVGFDDIPEAAYLTPPLTTVHQPFDEVGRRSLELLLDQIDAGERMQRREIVGPDLVIRASSAAPRAVG